MGKFLIRKGNTQTIAVDKLVIGLDLTFIRGSSNMWIDLERIFWSYRWSPCSSPQKVEMWEMAVSCHC
jgi:hypothetical protein